MGSSSGDMTSGLYGRGDIDNTDEMNAIEDGDDLLGEIDPEVLKEMEKRQDEITENFLEMALDLRNERRDELIKDHTTCTGQAFEDDVDSDDLPDDLQEALLAMKSEMNKRRKNGLKSLKARLVSIIESEEMQGDAKLQKLYD